MRAPRYADGQVRAKLRGVVELSSYFQVFITYYFNRAVILEKLSPSVG